MKMRIDKDDWLVVSDGDPHRLFERGAQGASGEVGKDLYPIEKQSLLPGRLDRAPRLGEDARDASVAGVPPAVLTDIGGRALVAVVGRRAVVEGEGAGGDTRAVIVQIADRVGQRIGVMAVGPVMHPRLRAAGG